MTELSIAHCFDLTKFKQNFEKYSKYRSMLSIILLMCLHMPVDMLCMLSTLYAPQVIEELRALGHLP